MAELDHPSEFTRKWNEFNQKMRYNASPQSKSTNALKSKFACSRWEPHAHCHDASCMSMCTGGTLCLDCVSTAYGVDPTLQFSLLRSQFNSNIPTNGQTYFYLLYEIIYQAMCRTFDWSSISLFRFSFSMYLLQCPLLTNTISQIHIPDIKPLKLEIEELGFSWITILILMKNITCWFVCLVCLGVSILKLPTERIHSLNVDVKVHF